MYSDVASPCFHISPEQANQTLILKKFFASKLVAICKLTTLIPTHRSMNKGCNCLDWE